MTKESVNNVDHCEKREKRDHESTSQKLLDKTGVSLYKEAQATAFSWF
jgi:hypothetical protein